MKVAHLTTVDMSLRYLVMPQLLAIRNAGAEVIGISAPGPWVPELEAAGIRHIPLESSTRRMNVLADLRAARELWHILRRERFDILHTHTPKPGFYGRVLGRVAGVPIVVNTVHGLYATEEDHWLKRAVVYGFEAIASRFSHAELVVSSEDLELLQRWHISPRTRSKLVGNGVDLTRFNPARFGAEARQRIRESIGVKDDQILVGVVGRLVAEKGYLDLFEAAKMLDDQYTVLAIGPHDPEKTDALSERILNEAQAAGVRFLGMRDDIDELHAALDIFVLPSHREGLPIAAIEATASGVPVIATDIRGCRQVVDHDRNGLLIPVRNAKAIATAIKRLGDEPETRHRMAQAGRQKAEAEYDERRIVETVIDTYCSVARGKGLHLGIHNTSGVDYQDAEPADAASGRR